MSENSIRHPGLIGWDDDDVVGDGPVYSHTPIAGLQSSTSNASGSQVDSTGGLEVYDLFYNESGGSIADGQWVSMDLAKTTKGVGRYIVAALTTDDETICVGVADEVIADASWGRIRRFGRKDLVEVAISLTAGRGLQIDAGTNSVVEVGAAGTTERIVGVLLEATGGSTTAAWVEVRAMG